MILQLSPSCDWAGGFTGRELDAAAPVPVATVQTVSTAQDGSGLILLPLSCAVCGQDGTMQVRGYRVCQGRRR